MPPSVVSHVDCVDPTAAGDVNDAARPRSIRNFDFRPRPKHPRQGGRRVPIAGRWGWAIVVRRHTKTFREVMVDSPTDNTRPISMAPWEVEVPLQASPFNPTPPSFFLPFTIFPTPRYHGHCYLPRGHEIRSRTAWRDTVFVVEQPCGERP